MYRIELTVKILEVGQLYALAHVQAVERGAKTIGHHPDITSIQGRNLGASVCSGCERMLNIGPSSNNGTGDHQSEGEQSETGNSRTTKPEDFSVSDQNDGQVLEDGVDGDREELQGLGAGEDHSDKEKSDGEP